MHLKLISLLIILILSLSFPSAFSNDDSVCHNERSFNCGSFNVGYLTYPFWGGHRPRQCGRASFQLGCARRNVPTLNISSIRYRVNKIDFKTTSLRVARHDLLMLLNSNTSKCGPNHLHVQDTYFDPHIFKYPNNSDYRNITLYFGCNLLNHHMKNPVNTFRCRGDGKKDKTLNLFGTKPEDVSCTDIIHVPINKYDALSLRHPNASSIKVLRSALSTGFWIQWLNVDGKEGYLPFCNPRVYRKNCQPHPGPAPVPGPAGSPATSKGNKTSTGNGTRTRAPYQSPAHPPQNDTGGIYPPNRNGGDSICHSESSYHCGHFNVGYLTYPFWGGHRPRRCGRAGFQLRCARKNVPTLNISSMLYRVKKIDFKTTSLRVARHDLLLSLNSKTSTCRPHNLSVHETYFDPHIFKYPTNDYHNITLYFGCKLLHNRTKNPVNTFQCKGDRKLKTLNLFGTMPEDVSCKDTIHVPIYKYYAQLLRHPNASSIKVLRSALSTGFWIQWLNVDGKEGYLPFCNPRVYQKNCQPHPGPDPPSKGNKTSTGNGVVLGVVLGVTGIVFLTTIGVVWFLKRRGLPTSADQENNYHAVEAFLLQHGPVVLKRYVYSEIKEMTKSLSDKLGQGGYGSVYKGNLHDGTLVAVKVLSSVDGNVEDFVNEVASISRTSHVNIVNLLGFCFDRKKRALVYEYMPNKSLDKYISNSGSTGSNCCLDIEILYRIAVGVAEGLDYLHRGCNTKIVHFDIKPQNILLDEEFCPKISDFGLARLCKKKQSLLSVLGTRGTVGYIAPEVFSRNFGGVSHKSDVYSYGMMVLQMAGANMIFDHTTDTTQSIENYFPDKIYARVLDKTRKLDGFVVEVKEETARKMLLIGFWCIQTNPSDRPSISKILEMLEGTMESIQIPPKPVLFTPTLPMLGVSSSFSSYVETQPSDEGVRQIDSSKSL